MSGQFLDHSTIMDRTSKRNNMQYSDILNITKIDLTNHLVYLAQFKQIVESKSYQIDIKDKFFIDLKLSNYEDTVCQLRLCKFDDLEISDQSNQEKLIEFFKKQNRSFEHNLTILQDEKAQLEKRYNHFPGLDSQICKDFWQLKCDNYDLQKSYKNIESSNSSMTGTISILREENKQLQCNLSDLQSDHTKRI